MLWEPAISRPTAVLRRWLVWLCLLLSSAVLAQPVDPLRVVADRNDQISTNIAATVQAIEEPAKALADLRRDQAELEQRMRWVERRASVQALGQEFAETLREYLRGLPSAEQAAAGKERRMELLAAASDSELAVERALHRLDDLDAASAGLLAKEQPPVSDAERPQRLRTLTAALRQQRDLLHRLSAEQSRMRKTLDEAGAAASALLEDADAARVKLTELLFWTPAPPGVRTLAELPPALRWTFSPAHWREAGDALRSEFGRMPSWSAAMLSMVGLLLLLRRRLRRLLLALSPAALPADRYRLRHALGALAVTCLLALPLPL
ncbi:MAG: hypothetical protein JNN21_04270, partial [Candidatus Accumulibacter sp.]|nr:hypothetical protein [Accumulibacter sp.]